ncbi:MAG: protease [Alphaproteobacteria bacterium GWF2_58_20]|nr:MAG: protease [Alphaproteobacteria bacterium GWF2_58_20]
MKPELVCPAGTPAALASAVMAGADAVYAGFRNETNARHFPGLNFSMEEMVQAADFAHRHHAKLYIAINTFPEAGNTGPWHKAISDAESCGADAVILADVGLCDHAARKHPGLRRHLSVQASACTPEALAFYKDRFGIARVVLPRVLTLEDLTALVAESDVPCEAFAFGGYCIMAEGRCALSGQACGISPNRGGACSPASAARFEETGDTTTFRLGMFALDRFSASRYAGYPTVCKGRYLVEGTPCHPFAEPGSLDISSILPQIVETGIAALKIEGRQRSRAYVAQVVHAFRSLLDGKPSPGISSLYEGGTASLGAYGKDWA